MKLKRHQDNLIAAFSLLEILAIISVAAILVTVLLGGATTFIETSRRAACLTKMKGLGTGIALYAADHNGLWPAYSLPQPDGQPPLESWSTSAARNYDQWIGLGLVYPYLDGKSAYLCPADKTSIRTYQTVDWNFYPKLWGSYVMRGPKQSRYPGPDHSSDEPLGRKLADMATRSLVSCFFMCYPQQSLKEYPLSHHNNIYPVLFGAGNVELRPLPSAINPDRPPDVWSSTAYQILFWDSFDGHE